ncbi:MAG: division/cell wall cluster transcriptional repressor MraZ [Bacteroidetes bacterium]|nr:division/cell wall cluster transcriptional repressor MraZ [Bacteroidota bacterium]
MQQLLGEYECKVDSKGRMRMPSGLMEQFGEEESPAFVINRGFENCLVLYPNEVWKQISDELNQLNQYNQKNREFVRYFYRGAQKLTMDGADRILVNKRLLGYAEIEKVVILTAVNDRIEMWSKAKYDHILENEPDDFSTLAEEVLGKANGNGKSE